MAKSNHTTYPTLTLLLGALVFTMSAFPGVNAEAKVASRNLSSSDCDDLRAKLGTADKAECNVQAAAGGDGQGIVVRATKKQKPAQPLWGDDQPATAAVEEVVELEAQVPCETCANGVRTVSATVKRSNAADLGRIAAELVKATENEMVQESVAASSADESCGESESDQPEEVGGLTEKLMECRVTKLNGLEPGEAAAYFDQHMRQQLQDMITGAKLEDVAARAGLRAVASKTVGSLVASLNKTKDASVYLKASIAEIQRFGQAHNLADAVLAKKAQIEQTNLGTQENLKLQQQYARLASQFQAERQYFASRGKQIAPELAAQIESEEVATLERDMMFYQASLDEIANQHLPRMGTNPGVSGATQPGVRPYGNGRERLGAPAVDYQGMPPGPARPIQQPGGQVQKPVPQQGQQQPGQKPVQQRLNQPPQNGPAGAPGRPGATPAPSGRTTTTPANGRRVLGQ